jgi:hypothetical protein
LVELVLGLVRAENYRRALQTYDEERRKAAKKQLAFFEDDEGRRALAVAYAAWRPAGVPNRRVRGNVPNGRAGQATGLPTATGTFYPDFSAELLDGRVLLVENKGERLVEHEQQKKNIGERWEETSRGQALFLWSVKKDEHGRDVHRQLQDKLAQS